MLAVKNSEEANSVSNMTDESNSFSITVRGHWSPWKTEKTVDRLIVLSKLKQKIISNYM